ncbi:hypothetical protein ABIC65_001110 [Sphingomonas trueperi]
MTDEAVYEAWNEDTRAWGRSEHAKVKRLCQFYRDQGIKQLVCE